MLTRIECTAAHLPALYAFLERHTSTSLFLLENMRNHGVSEGGPTYVMTRDGETVLGVASVNTGGMLLIQAPSDAASLSAFALKFRATDFRGILGPTQQVSTVLDALSLRTIPVRMHSDECLYELHLPALAVPASPDGSRIRLANETDLAFIRSFRRAYLVEALGAIENAVLDSHATADAERMCRHGLTFVLEDRGAVIAMTTFTARHNAVVQVGGVFTPPELRTRGYGRVVVAGSLLHAKTQWGATNAVLFTAEHNRPAQRAYEALGFRQRGGYTLHFFQEAVTLSTGST